MAKTVTQVSRGVPGAAISVDATVALDASYPNPAGYVFTAADFGLSVLRKLNFNQFITLAGAAFEAALIPTYNADNVTLASVALHLIVGTTGVEVANAVDVHTTSFKVTADGN